MVVDRVGVNLDAGGANRRDDLCAELVRTQVDGIRLRQYWDVEYDPDYTKTEQYFVERLRDLLEESVRLRLIADVGMTRALTVTYLIPLFGVLWGWLFLGETLPAAAFAGGALILAGTLLVTRG